MKTKLLLLLFVTLPIFVPVEESFAQRPADMYEQQLYMDETWSGSLLNKYIKWRTFRVIWVQMLLGGVLQFGVGEEYLRTK